MKTALYIDCCVRAGESRTRRLADSFFSALSREYEVTHLELSHEFFQPMSAAGLAARETLLLRGQETDSRFRLAQQLSRADLAVIAAPFWDLSFPAQLKLYIENVSVEGITFRSTPEGLRGLCRAANCVYLTTRGGFYPDGDPLEQATPYLRAVAQLFGLGEFSCVAADGLDVQGFDGVGALRRACAEAAALAKTL